MGLITLVVGRVKPAILSYPIQQCLSSYLCDTCSQFPGVHSTNSRVFSSWCAAPCTSCIVLPHPSLRCPQALAAHSCGYLHTSVNSLGTPFHIRCLVSSLHTGWQRANHQTLALIRKWLFLNFCIFHNDVLFTFINIYEMAVQRGTLNYFNSRTL